MRVTLVTCFNADWHHGRIPSPYVPLNLLSLASCLRTAGHQVTVVDQTQALLGGNATDGPAFHHQIAELIYATHPDIVGLTTMCNSYPQTISLARHYRSIDPEAKIMFGGPQASVVDVPTLVSFPWIDVIVRNEADRSLIELVNCWEEGDCLETVPGITWRGSNGQVHQNPAAPLLQDLDRLPFPAYDLYPLDQIEKKLIPIEAGRGCPYGCTFCSTNVYFNRRYRIKSPERLLAEMNHLHDEFGALGFDLVHDMLTVDRRWVSRFCRLLMEEGYSYEWGCSARIDRVDEELLAEMAEAGCIGIFFGVETGSPRLQPLVAKKLDVARVLPTLRTCVEQKMKPTGSFITGFPDETMDDMLASFNMALDILQMSPETRAQMHMLAPLVGSPLYAKHQGELQFDGHSSDISIFLLGDEEIGLVRQHPEIFPNFYHIPTPHLDRNLVKAVSAIVYTCPDLFIALRYAGADIEALLNGWIAWQRQHIHPDEVHQDYYLYHFGLDICCYLRAEVLPCLQPSAPFLPDLVDYFEMKYSLERGHVSVPTIFRQFAYDVQHITGLLRTNAPALTPEPAPTDLLFVHLALTPKRGYAFLEVKVPRTPNPLVRVGDELEIRDPIKQMRTRPDLIIRNNTQRRVFTTKHHLTERHLRALGLC